MFCRLIPDQTGWRLHPLYAPCRFLYSIFGQRQDAACTTAGVIHRDYLTILVNLIFLTEQSNLCHQADDVARSIELTHRYLQILLHNEWQFRKQYPSCGCLLLSGLRSMFSTKALVTWSRRFFRARFEKMSLRLVFSPLPVKFFRISRMFGLKPSR